MNKKFLPAVFSTAIILFLLNAAVYTLFLKDFFQTYPAISETFMKQLYRTDDQIIWWAASISAVAIGFLVTTVVYWSGARTFSTGLGAGFIFGFLLLCSVDFGLYASTNNFSLAGALADLCCSTTTITISSACAAWVLGKGKKEKRKNLAFERPTVIETL